MKKFNYKVKIGDAVQIKTSKEVFKIKSINENRNLIKIAGWLGEFQRSHVILKRGL